MLRSLFSGVSGMRNNQTRMDVIGNNIANVNTTAFKSGRVNFADQISQLTAGAAAPTSDRGGVNARQVGLGVTTSSIDTIQTQGNLQTTGKVTDLALTGDGYFIVSNGAQRYYTRAGNFDFDREGNYVDPASGLKVMGWSADTNGNINKNAPVQPLQIPFGTVIEPKATTAVKFQGNLDQRVLTTDTPNYFDSTMEVYDSVGNKYLATFRFTRSVDPTPGNGGQFQWELNNLTYSDGTAVPGVTLPFAPAGGNTLDFDSNGLLTGANDPTTGNYATGNVTITPLNGAADIVIQPNFGKVGDASGITSFADVNTAVAVDQDGYTKGEMVGVSIDDRGVISGVFSNGRSKALGQVAIATFTNPGGLIKAGGNTYIKTNNSGEAVVREAGSAGAGGIAAGNLEMSNVDLAGEFSNMIITERGFQANSRIITTSDELLQELINLKR